MILESLARFVERSRVRLLKGGMNLSESQVPDYSLPELLNQCDGKKVSKVEDWVGARRAEIIRLYEKHVYGTGPCDLSQPEFRQLRRETGVIGSRAVLKEIDISLRSQEKGSTIHLLLLLPQDRGKPAPVILGLNFLGNHTIRPDGNIAIHGQWQRPSRYFPPKLATPSDLTRGVDASRWPIEMLLERGYAVATAYHGDIEPDFPDGWKYGVRSALPVIENLSKESPSSSWGTIAVWAWGMSRILDYLYTDPDVDPAQVALVGHSRLGKAALWAGALDERFAMVVANNSGCGGAALFRRRFGETVKLLNRVRPHWFCDNFKRFNDREGDLPVDQHMLLGLMAPRPVYIASATEDLPADPRGEFLSAREAGRVYGLFGLTGVGVEDMPPPDMPIGDRIGYHIRSGPHDMTRYDWEQFIRFADRHFERGPAD